MEDEKEPGRRDRVLVEVSIDTRRLRDFEKRIKTEIYFNKQINKCPICGSKAYYIRILDRYYCFNCKDYLP